MTEFYTTDINGNKCTFQYIIEQGDILNEGTVNFKVYAVPKNDYEWFSYKFQRVDENTLKGMVMTVNGNSDFRKKGIPERIIEIAQEIYNVNVISSSLSPNPPDYLVGPSKNAWERLCNQNPNAKVDVENDCFILRRE